MGRMTVKEETSEKAVSAWKQQIFWRRCLPVVNLCLLALAMAIILAEWLNGYVTHNRFLHLFIVQAIFFAVWLCAVVFKVFNKIVIYLLLIVTITAIAYLDSAYFYKPSLFIIVVPHNFAGKIRLKLDYPYAKSRVKPLNGQVVFFIGAKGNFKTRSDYDIPFNAIELAEIKDEKIHILDDHKLINLERMEHDSFDGKYKIVVGDVVLKDTANTLK
jgi:hypothetical protein